MTKHITEIHREVINKTGENSMLSHLAQFATLANLFSNNMLPQHSMK